MTERLIDVIRCPECDGTGWFPDATAYPGSLGMDPHRCPRQCVHVTDIGGVTVDVWADRDLVEGKFTAGTLEKPAGPTRWRVEG